MSPEERPIAARIGRALTDATEHVEPAPDGWDRIAGRLEERPAVEADRAAARPRIFLVAAAALVVVVLGAALAVRARPGSTVEMLAYAPTTGDQFGYQASPGTPVARASTGSPAIVAVTADDRLVELDRDGREVRLIHAGPPLPTNRPSAFFQDGPIAVSPVDRTIYLERRVSSPCDDAYVPEYDVVGEIVAVPFAGGEPRVVVAAGTRPAISRDGTRLAYLGPGDSKHCDGPHTSWSVYVKDLVTGVVAVESFVHGPPGAAWAEDAFAPVQPAWTDQHDALVVQVRRPDGENLAGRCPTCGPTTYAWIDRLDDSGVSVGVFGADVRTEGAIAGPPDRTADEREAFDVAAAPSDATRSGQVQVLAGGVRGGGRIALAATTVDSVPRTAAGDRPVVDIDPSVFGDGPYVAVTIDASPDGTQVLVLATSAATVPEGERTRSAILWDGTSMRLLDRGFRAIGWAP